MVYEEQPWVEDIVWADNTLYRKDDYSQSFVETPSEIEIHSTTGTITASLKRKSSIVTSAFDIDSNQKRCSIFTW